MFENPGEGTDTVFASVNYTLTADVENLVLQAGADLQGLTATASRTALFGNSGNNLLDGGAGADTMSGGTGNDIYFVDNAGDAVTENANEGTDTVYLDRSTYTLGANVENLILQGGADLQGYGNGLGATRCTAIPATICSTAAPAPTPWRRCRQRCLFRRQCRRRGDRECQRRQRRGLRDRQLHG